MFNFTTKVVQIDAREYARLKLKGEIYGLIATLGQYQNAMTQTQTAIQKKEQELQQLGL